MYDGELEDMHDEFFVASDPTVKNDRLWHDKYSLRKSMIPNFITREQANRVLTYYANSILNTDFKKKLKNKKIFLYLKLLG